MLDGSDDSGPTGALVPNIAKISAHLFELFAPAFVQGYPDAQIEIAFADPKTGNAVNKAEIFSAFDLEKAALFAFRKNTAGFNVYVAPALRAETHKSGRASGHDIIAARYAWCEYDGKGDAERVYALCKANMLWPAIVVTTGTIPHQRNHLYFEIDGVPTPADLTAMGAGLKKLFGTDAVHNADRVLRLAGTVNWPSPKKMGPEYGYIPEVTTLRLVPDSPRYSIEKLIGLGATESSGAGHDHFGDYSNSANKKGRTDDEIIRLLEATRNAKSWHNSMRDAVASMIGRGWSDLQIKLACGPYSKGGSADPDVAEFIRGAREKWNRPDPKENGSDATGDLARLNKVHAVLPIGGKTRVVTFGELEEFPGRETIVMTQALSDFAALLNKYRHQYIDEGVQKEIPMGTFWLKSRYRRQFDGGMAFMPQHGIGVVGNKLNLWRGYGVDEIKPDGKSGAAGCDKFLSFMRDVICSGNEEHFDYLRKREAFIFQNRIRCEVAIGLRTEAEGCGKGFYEKTIGHLLGHHYMQITNPKHIVGAFNPHLETLLRMTADEALFAGSHDHRNTLFGLITEPKLTIEPKGCGVYQADNFLNISVLSNAKHFLPISGTARRFFIPTVSSVHKGDHVYFKAIQDQLDDGGFEALLYYFLNEVDLTDFNVRLVPQTKGLMEQRDHSLLPLEAWWVELLESGTLEGCDPNAPNRAVSNGYQRQIEIKVDNGTTQTRYVRQNGLYDQARNIEPRLRHHTSDHRLGLYLSEMGCSNEQKVLRRRGWTFSPLLECRKAWKERFPNWVWRDNTITEWRAEEADDPVPEPNMTPEEKVNAAADAAAKAQEQADRLTTAAETARARLKYQPKP